jgi:hypothetical protein
MSVAVNPAAPHHLPGFITAPGETDVLLYVMLGVVVIIIIMIGVLYLRLHALPEHIAHRTDKVQLQIVAVLGLLALFTHNHLYWIAGLLLALIRLPDFTTPLTGIASSLAKMASRRKPPPIEPPLTIEAAPKIELLERPPGAPETPPQGPRQVKGLSHV